MGCQTCFADKQKRKSGLIFYCISMMFESGQDYPPFIRLAMLYNKNRVHHPEQGSEKLFNENCA
jgi:hypothetical protein